MTLRDTKVH